MFELDGGLISGHIDSGRNTILTHLQDSLLLYVFPFTYKICKLKENVHSDKLHQIQKLTLKKFVLDQIVYGHNIII